MANIITGNELILRIDPQHVLGSRQSRNLNKLSPEVINNIELLTGEDLKQIGKSMEKLHKVNLLNNPSNIYHTHLRFCKSCVRFNYHSYLQQYKLIDVCPFHSEKYEEKCMGCGKEIYFYNIANPVPFTCRCGMQIYRPMDPPIWSNWSKFSPIIADNYVNEILFNTISELATCETRTC